MSIEQKEQEALDFILNQHGFNPDDFDLKIEKTFPSGGAGFVKLEFTISRISKNISEKYGNDWMEKFLIDLTAFKFGYP